MPAQMKYKCFTMIQEASLRVTLTSNMCDTKYYYSLPLVRYLLLTLLTVLIIIGKKTEITW